MAPLSMWGESYHNDDFKNVWSTDIWRTILREELYKDGAPKFNHRSNIVDN